MTKHRIEALQRRLNHVRQSDLTTDGIYGAATHAAAMNALETLATNPEDQQTMPTWLAEMTRRMGLHEVRDNRDLSAWLKSGLYLGNPKNLPWCGDAVETCFALTLPDEVLPENPFWAQGWKDFGTDLKHPVVGSVGVIRWSVKSGHVGFVIDWTDTRVKLRGGNQSNAINDRWFPRQKFIAFTWPASVPFQEYPRISGEGEYGGFAATR